MKYLLTLFLILLSINLIAQTSMSEYKYLKEGFKVQQESGLDMKDGYVLIQSHTETVKYPKYNRIVDFRYLVKTNNGIVAALQLIVKRTDTNYEEYLCIPAFNSSNEVWKIAKDDFKAAFKEWPVSSLDYAWGMYKMISKQCEFITYKKSDGTKYLMATNGGILNFLENGTYGSCPRCDYEPDNYLSSTNRILDNKYTDYKNFIEPEDGSRIEFFENGILSRDWKIFKGLIISNH